MMGITLVDLPDGQSQWVRIQVRGLTKTEKSVD
jgi:hypothetical protein